MQQALSWPSVPLGSQFAQYSYGAIFIFIGIVVFFHSQNPWARVNAVDNLIYPALTLILFAVGYLLFRSAGRTRKTVASARQQTIEATNSILMSKVEYLGGHPLLPQSGMVVLGLNDSELGIYTFKDSRRNEIQFAASIPLRDIDRTNTGRPKTAREIHDDYGSTIDVIEHSPFLHVSFIAKGDTYQVSFQNFEPPNTPIEYSNQIAALKYKLKSDT